MSDKLFRADLHIHSEYSMDCQTSLGRIIARCLELGINCVAIADHGTAEGGLKMAKVAPFTVIVAEEVLTTSGEIMGMFLKETIPSGLSLSRSIELIRAQGGLVNVPHPFDTLPRSGLGLETLEEIADEIDVIEAFNARSPFPQPSRRALAFASKHGVATSAGSDAHTPREIGNAFIEMPAFSGKDDFLAALARGTISGHKTSPLVHFASLWAKIRSRLDKRP
ncbi:MAG: PHP domain-containing protein [Chloroflexota bacterium]